jgi:hypothetical protein
MKISLKPDLRVETALPLSEREIFARVGYVNALLESRVEWGGLEADDDAEPHDALFLMNLAFMARMMATILEQRRENETLRTGLEP